MQRGKAEELNFLIEPVRLFFQYDVSWASSFNEMAMVYTRELAGSYDDFVKTMIQQSFAFVSVPIIGSDEPGTLPGQYGVGSMGKVQFQSEPITWIERFARAVLVPGSRVLQRLDPYTLHHGGPVEGLLALYVPKSKPSAMSIKEVLVPPPSNDPSCGIVFVTSRGYPFERGNGWCISFDLAINDYELDCTTRLQCLLQGLCPRLSEQLALAQKRTKLQLSTVMPYKMVVSCPSATRHPRPMTLSEAIFHVAACARPRSEKRVQVTDALVDDYVEVDTPPIPPTPTGLLPKRRRFSGPVTALALSPVMLSESATTPAVNSTCPPDSPKRQDSATSSPAVSSPSSQSSFSGPLLPESHPPLVGAPLQSPKPLTPPRMSSKMTPPQPEPSPCMNTPLLRSTSENDDREIPGETDDDIYNEETEDEQDGFPFFLDYGGRTPLPVNVTTMCPAEFASPGRIDHSPPNALVAEQVRSPTPLEPPEMSVNQSMAMRYDAYRWYEYEYSIDCVSAYKKCQQVIDDDNLVKLAYAFSGVDQNAMSKRYPCVVTLVKLGQWGRETFEVFGAKSLRQAVELVLRIHTKTNPKSGDAYVAMTGSSGSTNVAVDIPLDDGVPVEEVILKRRPMSTIRTMVESSDSEQTIHAWRAGGLPYIVLRDPAKLRNKRMTGLGIPKRRRGHNPPISCLEDAACYDKLFAQPKTLFFPDALRQMMARKIRYLKSIAFNQYVNENDYYPSTILSSGDWLADHHLEIGAAASRFLQEGGKACTDTFPLECKIWSKRCSQMKTMDDSGITLTKFLTYYLELIELFSRSGTLLGDAIFFKHQRTETAGFIVDVVFGRPESLARLFKETDNAGECLWVFRTTL